jgi:hypothetical protein
MTVTRRTFIASLAFACCPWPALGAASLPKILVTKDPNCGCCNGWVDHLRGAGFSVDVNDTSELNGVKARLGVPKNLWACHTAEIGRYVVEGHVPASAIQRLLREQPQAIGLAVPGMPIGSPGMEVEGSPPEEYTVFLFGSFGQKAYARFKAAVEITN